MMQKKPTCYDVVAVLQDVPDQGVKAGWVGTVVEVLDEDIFLVEFADTQGRTLLLPTLSGKKLLVLDALHAELTPV
ncbi:MAG: hypothetical protein ETSY2_25445 [Candidatus Entotheonella gemina]|uniref:DUF4926 domain-containing protein n=1 Tax=Candidatus Entotheonella gemina TaxID=1429439 RepID=W4M5V3_9BACT|nr:MAG: hypothetical protein ETSY2_25445 [Candidatus Entotheonella gemina]